MAHEGFTMSPPYGGLDLVSPIDNMDPSYALELVNVFPGPTAPITRKGYAQYVDLTASNTGVKTLIGYNKSDGTTELISVSNGAVPKIYKTVAGVATDITGTTGITINKADMQAEQFGSRLYLVNGTDVMQVYDGSTVADSTFTFPGGSGVTLADLINVASYKERLYFVQKNSMTFWYGNTQTVGASQLTSFDLQYVMKRGGNLLFAGSYTNQTGTSTTDLFWAISSEGEIVFYAGSSPSDTNWALVARFLIGKPLGYRAFIRVNNDVWILTQQGIVPLSALFQSDPEQALNVVSFRVNPYIVTYSAVLDFSSRWHGMFWPQGRRVYINVPQSEAQSTMLVYSIDTKGWCVYQLFDSEDNNTIAVADGVAYYGSNHGYIYTAESGYTDNNNTITFNGRTAFSFYGSRGNYKAFKDIRPLLKTKRGLTMSIGLDTDFQRRLTVDTVSTGVAVTTPWGSPWGSPWASPTEYLFNRYAVRGQGHSAAVRFGGSVNSAECQIFGFEIRFDQGGQV
jgi:hypothetical protein